VAGKTVYTRISGTTDIYSRNWPRKRQQIKSAPTYSKAHGMKPERLFAYPHCAVCKSHGEIYRIPTV